MKSLSEKVNPQQAALLVVDVQNDFCHQDGAIAKNGLNTQPMQDVIPALNLLIGEARKAGTPVIFIRTTHSVESDSPVWTERHTAERHYICAEGSWGAEWYQVDPLPEEPVVLKHRYSGFARTRLDELLRSMGVKSVIITGVVTNACVESTARDAFMHDYFAVVMNDCTAASQREIHEEALARISRIFGVVASSAEVIELWRTLVRIEPRP